MTPTLGHDQRLRLDFAEGLRSYAVKDLTARARQVWNAREQAYTAEIGHAPHTVDDLRREVEADPTVRFRGFVQRRSQETMWAGIHEALKPHEQEMLDKLNASVDQSDFGTIRLNPSLAYPEWFKRVDFHIQPGAYHGDDMVGYVLWMGSRIYGLSSGRDRQRSTLAHNALPRHDFRRILDIGSGTGRSTIMLKERFPEAEVFGVDLSAPMVKFTHMTAEEEGAAIHVSQQDGAGLDFEDASFDYVQSVIVFHELPPKAVKGVAREAYRVLKPGGLFAIADIVPFRQTDLYSQWQSNWQTRNNGEPYWQTTLSMDLCEVLREAGFPKVWEQAADPTGQQLTPWLTLGQK